MNPVKVWNTAPRFCRAFLLLFGLVLMPGCDTPCLESQPRKDDIRIDGNLNDWSAKFYRTEALPFGIAIVNDSHFLYICVNTWKQDLAMQLAHFGLTVRFKSKKLPGKGFAIKYPMGQMTDRSMRTPRFRDSSAQERPFEPPPVPDKLEWLAADSAANHEMSLSSAESLGIQAMFSTVAGRFVYELKLPLGTDSIKGFPGGAWKDSLITVEFESKVPEALSRPQGGMGSGGEGGGGMPPGGGGGMGGGGGGFGGGGMGSPGWGHPDGPGGHGGRHSQMVLPESIQGTLLVRLAPISSL